MRFTIALPPTENHLDRFDVLNNFTFEGANTDGDGNRNPIIAMGAVIGVIVFLVLNGAPVGAGINLPGGDGHRYRLSWLTGRETSGSTTSVFRI